jgi:hypothetical protein
MTGPGTNRSDHSYASGEREAAGHQAENLGERAREKASELKHQAEEVAHGLRERARSMADREKHAAVGRVEGVAHALRTASDELREQGQPMIAEYSQYAAEGLESMARSLDRRDLDDFVEGVEQFARERPIAFLGGAMVAGFALARFMKSSSERRYRRAGRSSEARPATAGMAANPAGGTTTPGAWTPDTGTPGAVG